MIEAPSSTVDVVLARRTRRHTSTTVALARTMYSAGEGWTPTEISRYLTGHGLVVSVSTIREWVVPGFVEARRAQKNAANARRRELTGNTQPEPSATPLLARMRELRAAGMFFSQIAIALRVDQRVDLSAEQARHYLRVDREPPYEGRA